jgi:SAM-dependent methyltransferase
MAIEDAMALMNRLLTHAQALGASIAWLRLNENGNSADPALRVQLERVIDALVARDALAGLTDRERAVVIAFASSYMRQAVELMTEPDRPNAWTHGDPAILQAQGAASAVVATMIAQAGLGGPGIRVLDIGTGVARLAAAFCREFPDSTVVGIDPWEPALALARANVEDAGLSDRIALHCATIQAFDDEHGFDLIWLPSFFIPASVLDEAFAQTRRLLRPDGALVVGVMEEPDDAVAAAVDAVITVRSGGAVLTAEQARDHLVSSGFTDVSEVDRTWNAPLRLVSAHG